MKTVEAVETVAGVLKKVAPAHIGQVSGHEWPYLMVWANPAGGPVEAGVTGGEGRGRAAVGVTMVAGTALGALDLCEAVRAVLVPDGEVGRVGGVDLRLIESQGARIDSDYTHPGTGAHPVFIVDVFQAVF